MKNKDRFIWIGFFVVALGFMSFLGISQTLYAEETSEEDMALYANMYYSIMSYISENYVDEVDPEELFLGSMQGMFESLDDPYSVYFTPEELRAINDTGTGEFGGVGLIISKPTEAAMEEYDYLLPYVQVSTSIEGSPGFRAGIVAGDYITHVDGVSTSDLTINEAVTLIRGVPGSDVILSVSRGSVIQFDVTVTRAIIEIPTIKYAMMDDQIAYLRILEFSSNTEEKILEAIEFFESNSYSRLVIDLRSNPGGLLSSVVAIADMFFNDGIIVSTESRIESENVVFEAAEGVKFDEDMPVVILINKGSASSSEILAGAMKDRGRALLLGETTFGKGLVQQVQGFWNTGFKLTVSRYFTPNGININEIGIEPDEFIEETPLTDEEIEDLGILLKDHLIVDFIDENRDPSQAEREDFKESLRLEGIALTDQLLDRMINNEINKYNNDPPVYDLDYDIVLQAAVELLLGNE